MKSGRTARQIKRNIKRELDGNKPAKIDSPADAILHFLAALIAILLPISLVALAAGAVFRVPDLMSFEIDRSRLLEEMGLAATPTAVAEAITDYLGHKSDALTLATAVDDMDVPVFSLSDEANLGKIRTLLDNSLIPSIAAFALSIILFIIVRLARRQRYLKYAMRVSLVIYICAVCFVLALALFYPFRDLIFAWQPGLAFQSGDVLPRFYGGFFPLISAAAICLVSFIIYIALYSVSRRFTVEKETMFS